MINKTNNNIFCWHAPYEQWILLLSMCHPYESPICVPSFSCWRGAHKKSWSKANQATLIKNNSNIKNLNGRLAKKNYDLFLVGGKGIWITSRGWKWLWAKPPKISCTARCKLLVHIAYCWGVKVPFSRNKKTSCDWPISVNGSGCSV